MSLKKNVRKVFWVLNPSLQSPQSSGKLGANCSWTGQDRSSSVNMTSSAVMCVRACVTRRNQQSSSQLDGKTRQTPNAPVFHLSESFTLAATNKAAVADVCGVADRERERWCAGYAICKDRRSLAAVGHLNPTGIWSGGTDHGRNVAFKLGWRPCSVLTNGGKVAPSSSSGTSLEQSR